MLSKIVLTPTAEGDRLTVDLYGDLAGILSVATNGDRPLVDSGLSWIQPDQQEAMVAGAGYACWLRPSLLVVPLVEPGKLPRAA